jgi:RNA polymerase sigma-70 factor (ECF subfamily)
VLLDRVAEQLLVLRCQLGDEQAFEQIVASYGSRLRYYLLKLLGSRDAADDVLQDVWLDVYRGIPRLRDPAAFRSWIYRIARNRAYRLMRRSNRYQPLGDNEELATDDNEFTAEDAQCIHEAIETLSAEHRDVLLLRFIENLSYAEIADIAGCSQGTVKSRIHYAKQVLRRTIEEESKND